ncbi:MAG: hypothetical protein JKY95_11880 [Planctomycetaceae bacterium]|nr:hypothetical protein [Planctomycetaceae bacterium]
MGKLIIGSLAVLLTLFLIGFNLFAFLVVPKWKDSFRGFGVELPSWQITIITISDLLVNFWYISQPLTAGICVITFSLVWDSPEVNS